MGHLRVGEPAHEGDPFRACRDATSGTGPACGAGRKAVSWSPPICEQAVSYRLSAPSGQIKNRPADKKLPESNDWRVPDGRTAFDRHAARAIGTMPKAPSPHPTPCRCVSRALVAPAGRPCRCSYRPCACPSRIRQVADRPLLGRYRRRAACRNVGADGAQMAAPRQGLARPCAGDAHCPGRERLRARIAAPFRR